MKKIIVYTAIFGNKDNLIEPENFDQKEECEFICFTDNKNLKSKNFKIIQVPNIYGNSRLTAKVFKILPHIFLPDHEISIWIDGNLKAKKFDLDKDTKGLLGNKDLVLFKHPDRKNIYDEAAACIQLKLDSESIIRKQITKYKLDSFEEEKLFAGGFIIRKNTHKVNNCMLDWWSEIYNYSIRDQISLPYILHKNKMSVSEIEDFLFDNKYFSIIAHTI